MAWRFGFMAVWLVLAAAWSAPPVAAIDRYTDSRGVIHISNVGGSRAAARAVTAAPEPPTAEQTPSASGEAVAASPPGASSKPGVATPAAPREPGPVEPPAHLSGASPAPEPVSSPGAEEVPPATATEQSAPRAFHPVAFVAAATRPQAGPPAPAAVIAAAPEGAIQRFRDRQGVLHITNAPPAADAAPPELLAREGEDQGPASLGASLATPLEAPALPLKKVAWNVDSPSVKTSSRKSAAPGPLAAASGTIHRYRDAQGVWHITNVALEEHAAPAPPRLQARALPEEENHLAGRYGYVPALADAEAAALTFRKAAWAEGDRSPPRPLKARRQSLPKSGAWTGETVTRYRDARGVVHIKSVAPPELRLTALPPRPPEHGAPPAPAVSGDQTHAAAPGAATGTGPPALGAGSGISAFRDPKGRLVIRNPDPEIRIGQFPRGGPAITAFEGIIAEAAQTYALPVALIKAVIKVESNFVSWAVSPKGAMGLMQLMPGTAAFLGVQDAFDPRENILGGCRYLRLLLDSFGGSLPLALAAYNAGYQRVIACGYQVPPIRETQDFVTNVLGRYYTGDRQLPWPWT